jgi:hypothetical protein
VIAATELVLRKRTLPQEGEQDSVDLRNRQTTKTTNPDKYFRTPIYLLLPQDQQEQRIDTKKAKEKWQQPHPQPTQQQQQPSPSPPPQFHTTLTEIAALAQE